MAIKVEWELGGPPERDFCAAGKELRYRYLAAGPMINNQVLLCGDPGQIALARRMVRELTHEDLSYRSKRLKYLSHVRECPACRLAVGSMVRGWQLKKVLTADVCAQTQECGE